MTNEEIIDYILYERLAPIIDSFDYGLIEESKIIEQFRQLYTIWLDETMPERHYCLDYRGSHLDNFIDECDKMIMVEVGVVIISNGGRLSKHALVEMLEQMRICMLKDKDNPFFKLKRIEQNKLEIEQDFQ